MKAEFRGGDYDVSLTTKEIAYLLAPVQNGTVRSLSVFPSLESRVLEAPAEEILNIAVSHDSTEIVGPKAHDRILFERDKDGPLVTVFAGLLRQLLIGELDEVGTRYDGHSDKIVIRKEDRVSFPH
ncbi:MAG: hypothetical protein M1444_00375 [Patescibacteria group bacterium]|nr:hypothetical protein [Patescibacteria group bacterium]